MSVIRLVGVVVGLATALVLSRTGHMWAVAPALAGVVLVCVLISELARPRPERQRGSGAAVEVRRVRDYVRPAAALGAVGLGIVLLGEMWLLAGAENHGFAQGRHSVFIDSPYLYGPEWSAGLVAVRGVERDVLEAELAFDCMERGQSAQFMEFTFVCGDGVDAARYSGVLAGIVGTAGTTLAVLVLAAAVIWATVRSPRAGTDEATRDRDERWRRGVVEAVLAVAGWIVAALVVVWNMALVLTSQFHWDDLIPVLATVLATVGFGAAIIYGAALLRAPAR